MDLNFGLKKSTYMKGHKPMISELFVLIAEDDYLIAEQLENYLKTQGITNIEKVISGVQILNSIKYKRKPDILFFNIKLADSEITEEFIREVLKIQKVPIIILTGYTKRMLSKKIFSTGQVYFIQKPFLRIQVNNVIQNTLNQKV